MDAFVNNFQEGMNFMWKIGGKKTHFIHITCGGILEFFEQGDLINLFKINLDKHPV